MTPSPQQQLLETIPSLRDWQSRFLLRFLQFLRWNRPLSAPQQNSGSVVDPLESFIGSVQHGSLAQSIDSLEGLTPEVYADSGLTSEQAAAIAQMQQRVQETVPEGVSLVDELIAERRDSGVGGQCEL